MHTQSHAFSLLLLDFLKPFLDLSHYFNRTTTECFWTAAPHPQQAMEAFQSIPEKKMWAFQSRQYFFIFEVPNTRKTTCAVSSPPFEAAPGDNIIPKYRVELCLRAEKLFTRTGTPATLLVPENSSGWWGTVVHI